MAGTELCLRNTWRVPGDASEVFDLLAEAEGWARWWPAVHPHARLVERGTPDGRGRVVELESRGLVPGRLAWRLVVEECVRPERVSFAIHGALAGMGSFAVRARGPYAIVDSCWRPRVSGVAAGTVSRVIAPLLALRYRGAMRLGELSLRLELRRRHAVTPHERSMVPPPPGAGRRLALAPLEAVLAEPWPRERQES